MFWQNNHTTPSVLRLLASRRMPPNVTHLAEIKSLPEPPTSSGGSIRNLTFSLVDGTNVTGFDEVSYPLRRVHLFETHHHLLIIVGDISDGLPTLESFPSRVPQYVSPPFTQPHSPPSQLNFLIWDVGQLSETTNQKLRSHHYLLAGWESRSAPFIGPVIISLILRWSSLVVRLFSSLSPSSFPCA